MARTYIVRYGDMRLLGEFTAKDPDTSWRRGTHVIARTDRGMEVGEILAVTDRPEPPTRDGHGAWQILREMSKDDHIETRRLADGARAEFETCQRFLERRKLPMQLVDVEHVFGGERIIFYFLAEGRVDFRELVKDLAREYQTRIEMRQIGVRDEAKLLADFGDCGLECCCNSHMIDMPPVSMRMAKTQKATLDPAKISGRCGRLKCCLRFEDESYEHLKRDLPGVGARVRTEAGDGEVVAQEVLAQLVVVQFEDRRRQTFKSTEIIERLERPGRRQSRRRRSSGGSGRPDATVAPTDSAEEAEPATGPPKRQDRSGENSDDEHRRRSS